VVVLWRGFDGGSFGEGKGEGESFGGVCWRFTWRWRRKKMKVRSWRSCSGCCYGGDEGGVGGG